MFGFVVDVVSGSWLDQFMETTYTANITPSFDGLIPRYEVGVYVTRTGGVCGPFTEYETVWSLDDADAYLARWGFTRAGDWGPVCANGFAQAELVER